MIFFWVSLAGVLGYYLSLIAMQYQGAVASPSSTVTLNTQNNAALPRVVVCNWNQNGNIESPIPTSPCPECNLTLVSCITVNDSADCSGSWRYSPYQTFAGLFYCFTFNDDPTNIIYSTSTGYGGGYATVWKLDKLNSTDPPSTRAGLQVSYLLNDGNPISDLTIYNEIRFIGLRQDSFFSLQIMTTINDELDPSDPNFNSTVYSTTQPAVTLLSKSSDPTFDYAGVSFAFQTLNVQETDFGVSYTLTNMFGDFANMIGITHGLDAIKLFSGIPLLIIGIKYRTINNIAEHFN